MPRDLRDVLDYFLPAEEAAAEAVGRDTGPARPPADGPRRLAALPCVALPIGDGDVVRSAFAWNLAVEVSRLGGEAALLAPELGPSPLWPCEGRGPLGVETRLVAAESLGDLHRAALDLAVDRAVSAPQGGLVLVRVPPRWLPGAAEGRGLLRFTLLFTSPDRRELMETYGLAKHVYRSVPEARVGVTVHGATRVQDAERAFAKLVEVADRRLRRSPESYGLLVDDLHVYRAIVARRPIGLERPQAPAARALRDVARTLLADACGA